MKYVKTKKNIHFEIKYIFSTNTVYALPLCFLLLAPSSVPSLDTGKTE